MANHLYPITGFTTTNYEAHLTSNFKEKKYVIYNRDYVWENKELHKGGFKITDICCIVSLNEPIDWRIYPQGEFVIGKCHELDRMIDMCISELNFINNK